MLNDKNVEFRYREYREDVLDTEELRRVFDKLGMSPQQLLRSRDAKKIGLRGDESSEELIALMAEHPTLLQRPILVGEKTARLGRPVENILEMI